MDSGDRTSQVKTIVKKLPNTLFTISPVYFLRKIQWEPIVLFRAPIPFHGTFTFSQTIFNYS